MITSNMYKNFGCKKKQLRLDITFQFCYTLLVYYCVFLIKSLLPVASCYSENIPLSEHRPQSSPIALVHNTFYF